MLRLSGLPLYYQNPVGRLYEHPDGYVVVDYSTGQRRLGDLQAFLNHLEHLLKRRNWNRILANQSLMTPFTEEESTWIREHWLAVSRALQQEMVAAILLPEDVFARLALSTMLQGAREGALLYRGFSDVQEAAAWLRQQS